MNYQQGDATDPQGKELKLIAHICNDVGGWGAGFVLALSKRWRDPEESYYLWYKHRDLNNFALGEIQTVQVELDTYVVNMVAQHDIVADATGVPPIRYDALKSCLEKLADEAAVLNASVHMPKIGAGLAGGDWNKIEALIDETIVARGIAVTIYEWYRDKPHTFHKSARKKPSK